MSADILPFRTREDRFLFDSAHDERACEAFNGERVSREHFGLRKMGEGALAAAQAVRDRARAEHKARRIEHEFCDYLDAAAEFINAALNRAPECGVKLTRPLQDALKETRDELHEVSARILARVIPDETLEEA